MSNLLTNIAFDKAKQRSLLNTIGRTASHALFPKDFEAYFVALELMNGKGEIENFLVFPVSPEQISETITPITNVKKTAGGIVTVRSSTFVPRDIEIKGNFGRNLRFVLGDNIIRGGVFSFVRSALNVSKGGIAEFEVVTFSNKSKTGYGLVKTIEDMFVKADQLDSKGRPRKLIFYNTILGNNYIVVPKQFVHNQNISANMIPQYSMSFTAVAPFSNLKRALGFANSFSDFMKIEKLDKKASNISKGIKSKLG